MCIVDDDHVAEKRRCEDMLQFDEDRRHRFAGARLSGRRVCIDPEQRRLAQLGDDLRQQHGAVAKVQMNFGA